MRSGIRNAIYITGSFLFLLHSFSPRPVTFASSRGSPRGQAATQRQTASRQQEVERWSALLKSSDEEERRDAAMMLSSIDGDAALSALTSALSDKSPGVRAFVVNALSLRGGESVAPLISARLAEDKDAFVRKSAAYALARFHNSERTQALINALKDSNAEVRGAAAVSLGDHPDSAGITALTGSLGDKSAFVRAQAARALGVNRSSAAQAVPSLIRLLTSDSDNEVKRQAAAALGSIGDHSALSALEKARRDRDPYLAQAAREAIRRIEVKE